MEGTTHQLRLRFHAGFPLARIAASLPSMATDNLHEPLPDDCFISHNCVSLEELEGEVERLKRDLEKLKLEARACFASRPSNQD
jgi:hypothetical protein